MQPLRFTCQPLSQLEADFQTSFSHGLSSSEVGARHEKYGANSLKSSTLVWPVLLKRQFASPFVYLLAGCALISFFLESKINAFIIIGILVVNGLIGFFQEYRASQSLQLLQEHLELLCTCIRDGSPTRVAHSNLVPGDIVVLERGNYVPADVRLIQGEVMVDESSLSGESLPVRKTVQTTDGEAKSLYQATNMAFLGTMVAAGSAHALVVAIGKETLSGEVRTTAQHSIEQSGFQERLTTLSRFLLIIIATTLPCLFCAQLLLKGFQVDLLELALFSLALVIGLTPEALPAVTMFALSKGAVLLARKNVVVKRLSAIEDLGSITLLCTDKTGTLTENTLSVASWQSLPGVPLKLYAHLIAQSPLTDSFDKALEDAITDEERKEGSLYSIVAQQGFDPDKRSSAVLVTKDSKSLLIVRGSLVDILKRTENKGVDEISTSWLNEQTQQGNRVLALAVAFNGASLDEEKLTLAGFISFQDPIKPTAVQAIKDAQKLGIEVRMLTGDSKEVGAFVAQKIGLIQSPKEAITADEFDALSDEEKLRAVTMYKVFARCLPDQKYRLVLFMRQAYTVGFLGDGINDAPALNAAHVGLVVQNASDIAKDAADIILLRRNLHTIIDGIGIGRNVFANTLKYIVTTISSAFGNFYSIAVTSLFIDFLPLLPRQILLINMISDFPMVAIATDTVDSEELTRPPTYILKSILLLTLLLGLISSLFDFAFFALFFRSGPQLLQSTWFMESILTELALIYTVRTHSHFFLARRPSRALLTLSTIAALITLGLPFTSVGQWMFHFTAPPVSDVLLVLLIVLVYFIVTDICKVAYYRMVNHGPKKSSST